MVWFCSSYTGRMKYISGSSISSPCPLWSILLMSGFINHDPIENFTSNTDLPKLEANSLL
ncbi:hypothetical protein I79_007020 [Cricetulus griseus]|uniref:Uncharacterized protein n=1 Tax=Cricetulus griseus TaxID=10029 RepID=G3H9F2_CRIGR|nr:hypothetical protein I79_007020 [Cricetulus griseus]